MENVSEETRCSRRGTPNWRCTERAMEGRAFCEKHHKLSVIRNQRRKMQLTSGKGEGNRGGRKKKRDQPEQQKTPEIHALSGACDGKELFGGSGVGGPTVSIEDLFGEDPIEPYRPTLDFQETVEVGASLVVSSGGETGNAGTVLHDLGIVNFAGGFDHEHVLGCDEISRLFGEAEFGARNCGSTNAFPGKEILNSFDNFVSPGIMGGPSEVGRVCESADKSNSVGIGMQSGGILDGEGGSGTHSGAIDIFRGGNGDKAAQRERTGGQCETIGAECGKIVDGGGVLPDSSQHGSEIPCHPGVQSDGGDEYGTKTVVPERTLVNCCEVLDAGGFLPKEIKCARSILCNEGIQIGCIEPEGKQLKVHIDVNKKFEDKDDVGIATPWDEGSKDKIDGGTYGALACLHKSEGETSLLKKKRGRPKGSKNKAFELVVLRGEASNNDNRLLSGDRVMDDCGDFVNEKVSMTNLAYDKGHLDGVVSETSGREESRYLFDNLHDCTMGGSGHEGKNVEAEKQACFFSGDAVGGFESTFSLSQGRLEQPRVLKSKISFGPGSDSCRGITASLPKRGRPKGSKGKIKLDMCSDFDGGFTVSPRKVGRPKGSKNKKKVDQATLQLGGMESGSKSVEARREISVSLRKRGRPKGSKNKKMVDHAVLVLDGSERACKNVGVGGEIIDSQCKQGQPNSSEGQLKFALGGDGDEGNTVSQRKLGRPKGSKNKKKSIRQ